MKLSDKTYTILKWVAIIGMPAVQTLWQTTAAIWGLPLAGEIGGTIGALHVCLGVMLGVSAVQYNKQK